MFKKIVTVLLSAALLLSFAGWTQQDDIRCLTQAGAQSGEIVARVDGDLPLADDAFLVSMEVFYRILKSNDMTASFAVDLIDVGKVLFLGGKLRFKLRNNLLCPLCIVRKQCVQHGYLHLRG